MIAALALLGGCIKSVDDKRMACLNEAANAPTPEGVHLKKSMCLLEYPLKPGQFVNGAPNPTYRR